MCFMGKFEQIFLDTQVSLAPTHVRLYGGSNALQKHIQTVEVGCKQQSGVVGRNKCC